MDEIHAMCGELPADMPDPLVATLSRSNPSAASGVDQRYPPNGRSRGTSGKHRAGAREVRPRHQAFDRSMGQPFAVAQSYSGHLKDFLRPRRRRAASEIRASLQSERLADFMSKSTERRAAQRNQVVGIPEPRRDRAGARALSGAAGAGIRIDRL